METLEIYSSGTPATVGNLKGVITACSIRGLNVQYEFTYEYEGEFKEKWLPDDHFIILKSQAKKVKIGFQQT